MYIEEWSEELKCQASEVHSAIVELIDDLYKKNEETREKLDNLNLVSCDHDKDERRLINELYKLNDEMKNILTEEI